MIERYPLKAGRYSSHSKILGLLGQGESKLLLDVGCAQGHLLTAAYEAGWWTVGIEYNEEDASVARNCGLDVRTGSAEDELVKLNQKFDVVVIADVLEHLIDPEKVLQGIRNLLAPGGKVIISLPNIAHLSVRLSLGAGRFNYSDRGILDRTHLHFYTRRSINQLCTQTKFEIQSWTVTPAPIEEVLPIMEKSIFLRWILSLSNKAAQVWKSGLAYQFIVEAVPTDN